uniref:Uncharacterized protein n=1 Tax=Papio anubis TaxID=9555 RepID=A0A8I5N1V1_PAPAN
MAELACVRESTSVAWACKVRGGTGPSHQVLKGLAWLPRPEYRGTNTAHCSLNFLGSSDLPASVPRVAGATAPRHYTRLTFVLFVETGFCHIAQAALEPLSLSLRPGCSSDPPTLASQGARITGMFHPSWFIFLKLGIIFLKQPQDGKPFENRDPAHSVCIFARLCTHTTIERLIMQWPSQALRGWVSVFVRKGPAGGTKPAHFCRERASG